MNDSSFSLQKRQRSILIVLGTSVVLFSSCSLRELDEIERPDGSHSPSKSNPEIQETPQNTESVPTTPESDSTSPTLPPSPQEPSTNKDDSDDEDSNQFAWHDMTPIETCDIWSQDCPEGEKCTMVVRDHSGGIWDAHTCAPIVDSPDQIGESCLSSNNIDGVDTCELGAYCMPDGRSSDERGIVGECWAFCRGAPDEPECPPMATCSQSGSGIAVFCIPGCDPLLQDCRTETLCAYTYDGFTCVLDVSDGQHPYGSECQYLNQCNPGLTCISGELITDRKGDGCCSPFCDLANPIQCDNISEKPMVCISFWEEEGAPEGYKHVGYCSHTNKDDGE